MNKFGREKLIVLLTFYLKYWFYHYAYERNQMDSGINVRISCSVRRILYAF